MQHHFLKTENFLSILASHLHENSGLKTQTFENGFESSCFWKQYQYHLCVKYKNENLWKWRHHAHAYYFMRLVNNWQPKQKNNAVGEYFLPHWPTESCFLRVWSHDNNVLKIEKFFPSYQFNYTDWTVFVHAFYSILDVFVPSEQGTFWPMLSSVRKTFQKHYGKPF